MNFMFHDIGERVYCSAEYDRFGKKIPSFINNTICIVLDFHNSAVMIKPIDGNSEEYIVDSEYIYSIDSYDTKSDYIRYKSNINYIHCPECGNHAVCDTVKSVFVSVPTRLFGIIPWKKSVISAAYEYSCPRCRSHWTGEPFPESQYEFTEYHDNGINLRYEEEYDINPIECIKETLANPIPHPSIRTVLY